MRPEGRHPSPEGPQTPGTSASGGTDGSHGSSTRATTNLRAAALTALATVVPVLLLVLLVRDGLGWDFELATRAPLAADRVRGPRYGGWLGSFGVIGWAMAAAISGFAAGEARSRRGLERGGTARFLLASAALSALLMVDDLFLLHSTVLPGFFGIPKPAVLLALIVVTVAWAATFRRRLLADPDRLILAWALAWYGLALTIDTFGGAIGWGGVREEIAKLVGVLAWLVFHWRVALRSVRQGGA